MAGEPPGTVLSPDQGCCGWLRQRNAARLDHRRKYRAARGGRLGDRAAFIPGRTAAAAASASAPNSRGSLALLRVPLHAEHEAGQTVELGRTRPRPPRPCRPASHATACSPSPSRSTAWWWWVGTSKQPGSGRIAGQRAVRADPHLVQRRSAVRRPVVPLVPDQVGQVLVQRAAPAHVQHLHAPADGQQRHALPPARAPVTARSQASRASRRGCGPRVPRRAVPDRVDVRAARARSGRPGSATVALASASSPPGGSRTARPPLRRTASTYT